MQLSDTAAKLAAGAKAVVEMGALGRFAGQEEAEERAAICSVCALNERDADSLLASAMERMVQARGRATRKDANLGICGVCGCALAALVHSPDHLIEAPGPDSGYPGHCWKRLAGKRRRNDT